MPSQGGPVWEKNHPGDSVYAGNHEGTSNNTGNAMLSLLYDLTPSLHQFSTCIVFSLSLVEHVEREEGGNDKRVSEQVGYKDKGRGCLNPDDDSVNSGLELGCNENPKLWKQWWIEAMWVCFCMCWRAPIQILGAAEHLYKYLLLKSAYTNTWCCRASEQILAAEERIKNTFIPCCYLW